MTPATRPSASTRPSRTGNPMTTFIITAIVLLIVVLLCWAAMMRPGQG
jgi:hypothetical protein